MSDTTSTLPTEIRVWCHACEAFGQASLSSATSEYECTTCRSDCVEKDDQGIEVFQESIQPSTSMDETQETNELVQQVMDRILGLSAPMGAYQTVGVNGQTRRSRVRQRADDLPGGGVLGPRPVSAMRQFALPTIQLSGDADLSQLGGFGGVPNAPGGMAGQASHQSVFGLLSSLNSMRTRPAMFSTTWGTMGSLGTLDGLTDEVNGAQWEDFLHHILMNESSRAGAPPASKQVLDGLPRHTIADEGDAAAHGECYITQESFEVGEVMIPLPCGHNYKQEPILHWLEMHNTCPVCRVALGRASCGNVQVASEG